MSDEAASLRSLGGHRWVGVPPDRAVQPACGGRHPLGRLVGSGEVTLATGTAPALAELGGGAGTWSPPSSVSLWARRLVSAGMRQAQENETRDERVSSG